MADAVRQLWELRHTVNTFCGNRMPHASSECAAIYRENKMPEYLCFRKMRVSPAFIAPESVTSFTPCPNSSLSGLDPMEECMCAVR